METRYAELHAHSAYTFLEGTSQPADLVREAKRIGLSGLGILDVNGFYSAVQTAKAASEVGLPCVYGTEVTIAAEELHGFGTHTNDVLGEVRLPIIARNQQGYSELCQAISDHNLAHIGQRSAPWFFREISDAAQGNWFIMTGSRHGPLRTILRQGVGSEAITVAKSMVDYFIDLYGIDKVIVESDIRPYEDDENAHALSMLANSRKLPLVATGATKCANQRDQYLADVMTASGMNLTLEEARPYLPEFGTFLRSADEMLAIHHLHPQAVHTAAQIADECTFDLCLIAPQLPHSVVPDGYDDDAWLRKLTYIGAEVRYGRREDNSQAWGVIDRELEIIAKLDFSGYFLIVKDIVDFCVGQGILCQGRGSAANSAVCYALGITAVDAVKHKMMFERFLSPSRKEAPDIDIDIESKRREEVIQYVYERYGRRNAAQVANTITYRPKSAVRAAGGALGYGEETIARWSKGMSRGAKIDKPLPEAVASIASSLQKLPRHMGVHPGGMVLTRSPVSSLCPVEWAAKEDRTVLQWDKEDCADVGLVKFDLLGLGMLTALRVCFNALNEIGVVGSDGKPLGLYNIPADDAKVYDLLCAAETVGVFQVESRAQMSTLPRLRPRCFYDLVIEVALIRPGPIQGRAVNPYLDRRNGRVQADCHPRLKPALERTLGVPLFQEQLMKIAVDAADFTPSEADELRRAIGSKRHAERMELLKPKLYSGMQRNGIPIEVQEDIFDSLSGFAEFGFPESHAFSFAYLVYASAWLKVHYPEHFYAGLLASQPMGFYTAASLITDAKRLGVEVLGPSVVYSCQKAQVEKRTRGVAGSKFVECHSDMVVRLGLDAIKGLSSRIQDEAVAVRSEGPFLSLEDFAMRTRCSTRDIELIAKAGGFDDLGITRRNALWFANQVANPNEWQQALPGFAVSKNMPDLPEMNPLEQLEADYESMSLSTCMHPMEMLRAELAERDVLRTRDIGQLSCGSIIEVAGIVTHRQRPGTAAGVTFLSLEDETGLVNVICTIGVWKRFRSVALSSRALVIKGKLEKKDGAFALKAQKIEALEVGVSVRSRDFH